MKKIAAAYIRVSTDDQVEYSPESQRKAILDYAKRNGYYVPEEYIFADEGISGRSTKRPAFQQMIGTAKQKPKPFDAILVWKFSRFARNREDSIVYKSMLRKQCGIDVVSISEQLGEDKTSILIEALLEAMDEYYSINLAEEVVRGMSEKARRGGIMGGLAFGYKSEGGKLVPDPQTAPIVQRIFADYDNGINFRRIVHWLNSNGITTKNGNRWDNRGVEYVLRNVTYTGRTHWTPGGTSGAHADKIEGSTIISDVTHTPIVDEEMFRRVQERITEQKQKYGYKAHPNHGRLFALKGLVRCSACGATLTNSGNGGVQCHRYATGLCKESHFVTFGKLNQLVIDKLRSDMETGHFKTVISNADAAGHSTADADLIAAEVTRIKTKLRRAKEAYQAGVDTLDEYRESKTALQAQIDSLMAQKQEQTPPERETEHLRTAIKGSLQVIESDAPEELKNNILSSFVQKIVFNRKSCTVDIFYNP